MLYSPPFRHIVPKSLARQQKDPCLGVSVQQCVFAPAHPQEAFQGEDAAACAPAREKAERTPCPDAPGWRCCRTGSGRLDMALGIICRLSHAKPCLPHSSTETSSWGSLRKVVEFFSRPERVNTVILREKAPWDIPKDSKKPCPSGGADVREAACLAFPEFLGWTL